MRGNLVYMQLVHCRECGALAFDSVPGSIEHESGDPSVTEDPVV